MGKASSSKKVARAAGTGGGRTSRANTPWPYLVVIAVIVVLGVAFTWVSRSDYESNQAAAENSNANVAPKVGGTAWYEGYAIYACGKWLAPLNSPSNKEGLTTAKNGVIKIAPKTKAVAGKNATVGAFASAVGMTLDPSQLKLPDGRSYTSSSGGCGNKDSAVYVKEYPYVGGAGSLQTAAPNDVLLADDSLITIAFVPNKQKSTIPAPPTYVGDNLTKITTPATTTTPKSKTKSKSATSTTTSTSTTTAKSTKS